MKRKQRSITFCCLRYFLAVRSTVAASDCFCRRKIHNGYLLGVRRKKMQPSKPAVCFAVLKSLLREQKRFEEY